MLEMSKYMEAEDAAYYTSIAKKLIKAMIDLYAVKDSRESNGQLLHGTYSKKTPYNTCTPEGVDECVIWGRLLLYGSASQSSDTRLEDLLVMEDSHEI